MEVFIKFLVVTFAGRISIIIRAGQIPEYTITYNYCSETYNYAFNCLHDFDITVYMVCAFP